MMSKIEFRAKVIEGVKERLGEETWFRGVCLDNLDNLYQNGSLEAAINEAEDLTRFWNEPASLYN